MPKQTQLIKNGIRPDGEYESGGKAENLKEADKTREKERATV